ncbi:MAG: 2-oxoacid:acceptor oxidoreductase family protein, partial [Chloroflexi bacterium]|nr:2-oxoacid:acceptor oxidoreductase family protein [Chloroflexota bacterium]
VRFQNQIAAGGCLLYNSSLIEAQVLRTDIDVIAIPASRTAEELGSGKSANMIMLGAFTKRSNLVTLSTLMEQLAETLKGKEKLIAVNRKALTVGYGLR